MFGGAIGIKFLKESVVVVDVSIDEHVLVRACTA